MADAIEPFMIGVDGAALEDLRDRLRRARWPGRETVGDWSQGRPAGLSAGSVPLLGTGSRYSAEHGTRPQTIGYSLTDSPAGLCAWIVEKLWAWTDHPGDLSQVLTADQVLDNISLYWLTGSGASSARLYWESITEVTQWFTTATGDVVTVPAGCSVFPKETPRPSRRWAQRRVANIVRWSEPDRGGHFAAWEQPGLFTDEVRAVARATAAQAGARYHPQRPA